MSLLPFHTQILNEIHDPATSELLVIARGLGLRRILCTLLQIYDSPQSLILLVNATQEEETEIGEELGIMGCRRPGLRVLGYEIGSKERRDLYGQGGLVAVTSRILVVDMLQGDIPVDKITGIMVVHAEQISPLHLVSFIARLYREKNKDGFIKAFTDQPEHITSGMSPLKTVMKQLHLRRVFIYPRFHANVKAALERRRADVVELSQSLTQNMEDIHSAIISCMNATLTELRRSRMELDLDILSLPYAYFPSFDHVIRKHLDPVWHKVGWGTKGLVSDFIVFRRLLSYLLSYDALQFHEYCQSLIAAADDLGAPGKSGPGGGKSQWMLTDAAEIIFNTAKRRCYTGAPAPVEAAVTASPAIIDLDDEHDLDWDILDELEGRTPAPRLPSVPKRPAWLPQGVTPVLEELPKWSLLKEVLEEIESEIIRMDEAARTAKNLRDAPGSNTTLVMCSSKSTATLLGEYLASISSPEKKSRGEWGRTMMMRKFRGWVARHPGPNFTALNANTKPNKGFGATYGPHGGVKPAAGKGKASAGTVEEDDGISEALKKKDRDKAKKLASRRRVRGGAPGPGPSDRPSSSTDPIQLDASLPEGVFDFGNEDLPSDIFSLPGLEAIDVDMAFADFDEHYGLITPPETVLIRPYSDDSDDRMLDEIKPRFIVMFEPCMEFVRRVEVYKCSNPGLAVRVYHVVYTNSCEEHKYLAGIRREKESFERLIRERGSMLLPIYEDKGTANDAIIKTISTRIAGGRRELNKEPSRVIVDMREFRSTLPSLLHAANLLVVPATLTVGDYILTPEICVERKSLSDLVASFNSGRLYTQCELMSVHYKNPVLLIEFEEDRAFSLEIISDMKTYGKPSNRYPAKKKTQPAPGDPDSYSATGPSIQSKIVLLTLSFPRVRIIWSSSPYATAEIFNDLKHDCAEPDPVKAVAIGAEEDPEAGAGINSAAEELLRSLPGITAKNVKYVMSRVKTMRELCEMDLEGVKSLLGAEPGQKCWEFMHRGDRKR